MKSTSIQSSLAKWVSKAETSLSPQKDCVVENEILLEIGSYKEGNVCIVTKNERYDILASKNAWLNSNILDLYFFHICPARPEKIQMFPAHFCNYLLSGDVLRQKRKKNKFENIFEKDFTCFTANRNQNHWIFMVIARPSKVRFKFSPFQYLIFFFKGLYPKRGR